MDIKWDITRSGTGDLFRRSLEIIRISWEILVGYLLVSFGISLGEDEEIFLGDIKDKSGYHQNIAGRSMLEM